jgi:pyruvate kinase
VPTRRTKIVATLGPSSNSRAEIEQLVRVGMDVARMNFSHGSHAEHAARIATVRAASQACGRSVGVLLDLQGPKIRTGTLRGGAAVEIPTGGRFVLTTRPVDGDTEQVTTSYEPLPTDVEPGDRIFLSDGSIALRAIETTATDVVTEVVYGGTLKERQGINLPGVRISAAGVTEKDVRDLAFGLEQEVDYVAISFVRSADDVLLVKRLVTEHGRDTPVIASSKSPRRSRRCPRSSTWPTE